ncbi:protein translocase subunit SecF, partial [Patescibacteria group bacterium]|nr:protein translocase subunit SecF [Patescibacteria group bacterium]
MFIVKHKKIFIGISIVLVILSIISLSVFGLKVGIDFKGGALTEVVYKTARPTHVDAVASFATLIYGTVLVQPTGELGYIIKSKDLNEVE